MYFLVGERTKEKKKEKGQSTRNHPTTVNTYHTKRKMTWRRVQQHDKRAYFAIRRHYTHCSKCAGASHEFLKLNNIYLIQKDIYALNYPQQLQKINVKIP
jgi:hypothetical protein